MIVYKLICPDCHAAIQEKIDEMTYINNLMNANDIICSSCQFNFVPEDTHYEGTEISHEMLA